MTCESEEDEIQEVEIEEQVTMQSAEVAEAVELFLNSVIGFTTPGTMKIKGSIGDQAVAVLIDCGATHNFIVQRLIDDLKLPITVTKNYGGSGRAVKGKGVCEAVAIKVADITIVENFLPLELGNSIDVILGMQWLYTLGITEVDWRVLSMKAKFGEAEVKFKGDPSLTRARVSLTRMAKEWDVNDQGFLVECHTLTVVPEVLAMAVDLPNSVKEMIDEYTVIFQPPQAYRHLERSITKFS